MFEYFPGNYVWNLFVNIAMSSGAQIGEVDQACRPALEASKRGEDAGTGVFIESWTAVGDRLCRMAEEDLAKGRKWSAGEKLRRATVYFATAERAYAPRAPERMALYKKVLDTFLRYAQYSGAPVERVEIPYDGTKLAALFAAADGAAASSPAPCMLHFDGFDAYKELLYLNGFPAAMGRRGVSTLIVDHPGVGEALRLQGLTVQPKTEIAAGAALNYLETRPDVDKNRIGMVALSMGGYYAPRATAFEKRIKCCVAYGGNFDWGAVQRARFNNLPGGKPVPHFWDHFKWALGQQTVEAALDFADQINLRGILDRIEVPILISHGEGDRQIPLKYAQMTYDACTNSPRRELKIHTREESAAEHCSLDNPCVAIDYMADWIAEVLGGRTS